MRSVGPKQRWWKRNYKRWPLRGWATGGFAALTMVGGACAVEETGQLATADDPTSAVAPQPVADLSAPATADEVGGTETAADATAPTTMLVVTLPPDMAAAVVPITTAPTPTTTTSPPPPAGPVVDIAINFDAAGNDNAAENKNDEWVRFGNGGSAPLDMTGWVVADDGPNHTYRFGQLVLQPSEFVMLRSGCGNDTAFERFWCNPGSAVWNNDGDTVHLYDAAGALIATRTG